MKTSIKIVALMLVLTAFFHHHANAQATATSETILPGQWKLVFEMPGGANSAFSVHFEGEGEALQIVAQLGDAAQNFSATLESGELTIDLALDHANILCLLYKKDDDSPEYAGLCEGPMGEIPSVLTPEEK